MALVPFSHASPYHDFRKLPFRLFSFANTSIQLEQAWKQDGNGGTDIGFVDQKRVLELGCGPGLVAIVAALLGATETIATDGDTGVVELATRNIFANASETQCRAMKYLWGSDTSCFENAFDVILAADIVACPYEKSFSHLLHSFEQLCQKNRETVIYMAYKKRHGSEDAFFIALRAKFSIETLPSEELHCDFQEHHLSILKLVYLYKSPV